MLKYIVDILLQYPCVVLTTYADYNYIGLNISCTEGAWYQNIVLSRLILFYFILLRDITEQIILFILA
jgi:hypothetical protein